MMRNHVTCLGNSTLDRVWLVDRLPATGGKFKATDYFELGGGMAANAAVTVARLGGQASYCGRAGSDTAGQSMREELSRYGVNVEQFRLIDGARSPVSAIFVSHDGERMIVNFRGTGLATGTEWLALEQLAQADAVHADVRWVEGAHALYTRARALGIPTILDGEIADRSCFSMLLPLVDHAIFSETGLRSFHGDSDPDDDMHRIMALQRARDFGCRVAAVTRGPQGTFWLDDNGAHRQPAFPVKVVDTTGAGDVFHGAYALAIGEGREIAYAMRFASAVAALKCTLKGSRAGIPTRAEADALLEQQPR